VSCPWQASEQSFAEVLAYAGSVGASAIIPVSEASLAGSVRWDCARPPHCLVLRPAQAVLDFSLSKLNTFVRAQKRGLPVAPGIIVGSADPLPAWPGTELPCVVRTDNHWSDQHSRSYIKGRSWIVRTRKEFEALHDELQGGGERYLVQTYITGRGCGVFLFVADGRTQLWYSHERLAEIPWTGGVSARRRLTFNQELKTIAEKFLDELPFCGIAMVEFRQELSAQHTSCAVYLVELNARPWGSLAVALHAEIPLVSRWVAAFGLPAISNASAHLVAPHSEGKASLAPSFLVSGLYPGEFQHLASVFQSVLHGELQSAQGLKFFRDFLQTLITPSTRFDYWLFDDRRPCLRQWIIFLLACFKFLKSRVDRFINFLKRSFLSLCIQNVSSSRVILSRSIIVNESLRGKPKLLKCRFKILVVCQGNRCRSPFVEKRLRLLLPANTVVVSRGLQVTQDRDVPRRFHRLFQNFGLAPQSHTSRQLEESDVQEADLIVVMESEQRLRVLQTYGRKFARQCVLLTAVKGLDRQQDIRDPYLLNAGDAREEFERMDACCRLWAQQWHEQALSPP
jgi:protein-tyrosine phosphatase